MTSIAAGEYTAIGHPKGDNAGKVLEIGADECFPTGLSNPQRGREYRQRYFRNHPRGREGNP